MSCTFLLALGLNWWLLPSETGAQMADPTTWMRFEADSGRSVVTHCRPPAHSPASGTLLRGLAYDNTHSHEFSAAVELDQVLGPVQRGLAYTGNSGWQTMGSWTVPVPLPTLTISKSHSGSFTPSQNGAAYTVTLSNAGVTLSIPVSSTGSTKIQLRGIYDGGGGITVGCRTSRQIRGQRLRLRGGLSARRQDRA